MIFDIEFRINNNIIIDANEIFIAQIQFHASDSRFYIAEPVSRKKYKANTTKSHNVNYI